MKRIILAVGLLFSLGIAHAVDTPVSASFLDFSGGLNDYQAPMYIAKNESPNLLNVVIDEPLGVLQQRKGYQTCGNTPSGNTATALYEYVTTAGTRYRIVSDNTSVWSTADCVTFSTVVTGLSSLDKPRFATITNRLWIVNGSTYPYVWDGSSGYFLDGTNSHPLAPKAKYLSYWKSRVFMANTPTDPSSVQFSQLTDDAGTVLDPAVSTMAWANVLNTIYINRGDGSPIYGLKLYRDNLYVFKETGVNRIIFESDYNIQIGKNVTTVGCKFNDAIVEMDDGLLRYPSRDGLYAFNGVMASRVSAKWTTTYNQFQQPTSGEQYHLWDTYSELSAGSNYNTFVDTTGYVSLSSYTSNFFTETFNDNPSIIVTTDTLVNPSWYGTSSGVGTSYALGNYFYNNAKASGGNRYSTIVSTDFVHKSTTGYSISFNADLGPSFALGLYGGSVYISALGIIGTTSSINSGYGYRVGFDKTDPTSSSKIVGAKCAYYGTYGNTCVSNGCEIILPTSTISSPVVMISYTSGDVFISTGSGDGKYCSASMFTAGTSGETGENHTINYIKAYLYASNQTGSSTAYSRISNINISSTAYFTNGIYISPIATASTLSSWKTFSADQTLNNQSITYAIRTATSAYNVTSKSWRSITPGSIVSTTTENYVQWAATFTTTDNGVTPLLNSASIGWNTGANVITPITGINYLGRYWVSASTTIGGSYNDITMVESRPPLVSYVKHDLPIGAYALWDNILYGSIGGTSKIARLDYGETDDGKSIHSYWESRDEMFDSPYYYKSINLGILDYSNTPANPSLNIGLSPDMGENYQYRPLDVSASTLPRNTKKLNYDANRALGFRARIDNTQLGVGYRLYGLHLFGSQNGFMGN